MSVWDDYPADYRQAEIQTIIRAARGGESVAVVGLSGAGKSNLLAYLANRAPAGNPQFILVDANRLSARTPAAFFELMRRALGADPAGKMPAEPLAALEAALDRHLAASGADGCLCFLLDLSLAVDRAGRAFGLDDHGFYDNLRALRDAHKYQLAYVLATRHPLPADNELAELLHGHTVWLGPLAAGDARWNVERYAARLGLAWDAASVDSMVALSGGYPALLRATCEAHATDAPLTAEALAEQPAVSARLDEFWSDAPTEAELKAAGLDGIALLMAGRAPQFDTGRLTAKENRLLEFFLARPAQVCEKDEVIQAVWPEDRVFERGVRDDSLAQLVRRLREKIEADPANPRFIQTVPGRGYRFTPRPDPSQAPR